MFKKLSAVGLVWADACVRPHLVEAVKQGERSQLGMPQKQIIGQVQVLERCQLLHTY